MRRLEAFNEKLEQEVGERTEALQRAREQLVHKERLAAIGELAFMVVHEVRTPLSTMKMAFEYLESADLDERALRRLTLALRESTRLEGLLKEILLYANPGNGHSECVSLRTLVDEVVGTLRAAADRTFGNIRVSFAEAQLQVNANADKLRQVIINLLSNACEASPATEQVHLSIAPVNDDESVRLGVRNATAGDPLDTEHILQERGQVFPFDCLGEAKGKT